MTKRLRDRPAPNFNAAQAAIEAASEVFRLAFPDVHEATMDTKLLVVVSALLECGLRRGEGCAEIIEFIADLKHKKY